MGRVFFTYSVPRGTTTEADLWALAVVTNGGAVSEARKVSVGNFIGGLKADGIWNKLDRLWLFSNAADNPSRLTDIKGLSLATLVGSPPVGVTGYTGEDAGGPTNYIDSNYNPTIHGVNYTQDSAHISFWSATSGSTLAGGAEIGLGSAAASRSDLRIVSTDSNCYCRINDSGFSGSQGPTGTQIGHWIANRSGASASQLYHDGSLFSSPNQASATMTNGNYVILALNNVGVPQVQSGTPNTVSMASIGASLSSGEAASFFTRLSGIV